jgi:SpoVK/Ycf46/Vps4 family AAA+-type ATPase
VTCKEKEEGEEEGGAAGGQHPLEVRDYDDYDSDVDAGMDSSRSHTHRRNNNNNNNSPIFLLVASSRPDLIDPALLRPGRIEKHVYMNYPSEDDVVDILQTHIRHTNQQPSDPQAHRRVEEMDNVLRKVAAEERARSFTPADLKAIVDTAYLLAVHDRLETPSESDGVLSPVCILPHHVWRAFVETRASIAAHDRAFFDSIHARFVESRKAEVQPSNSTEEVPSNEDTIGLYRSANEITTQKMSLK